AGDHLLLRFDDAGNLSNRYVHGPAIDQILADEQINPVTGGSNTIWPLTDNLGTIRDLADFDDVNGLTSVANHIVYDSFGKRVSESNAAIDHLFGYTGREWDEDVDLQYNRARWYDPEQGRFVSNDPIGFNAGDANLYRYVGNQVTTHTDPSGLLDNSLHQPAEPTWWQRMFFGMKSSKERAAEEKLRSRQHLARFILSRRAAERNNVVMNRLNDCVDKLFVAAGGNSHLEGGNGATSPHRTEQWERRMAKSQGMSYDDYLDSIISGATSEDLEALSKYDYDIATIRLQASIMPVVGMARTGGGHGAFRQAKRDLGIPMNQRYKSITKKPLTDKFGKNICGDDGLPIMTREYVYDLPDGREVIIQDHSGGHPFFEDPHFNVRPIDKPRHGTVPGTQPHYPFGGSN
ncbi:MAG TPA: RHS repeat-associated core domain-containing protein, partial [Pirellulaceae bacterium]|nr:RHS repeat-associated core domain-containing protein [Pirellulaceae bacterium]